MGCKRRGTAAKKQVVDRSKVYAIRMPRRDEATSIALYAEMGYEGFNGICYLTPPERGHMIEGKLGKKTKTGFTFTAERWDNRTMEFIEVTYENFRSDYHKLVEGSNEILAEVSTTEELQDWFHRAFPM